MKQTLLSFLTIAIWMISPAFILRTSAQLPGTIWARHMGVAGKSVFGMSNVVDASGNLYVAGNFSGTVDFDPGAGIASLTSTASQQDMFVAKYDASGNCLWAKGILGSYSGSAQSIAIDGAGNIYISGSFSYTTDFDPGTGVANLTAAGTGNAPDIFIARYDNNGNYIWAKKIGNGSDDRAWKLVRDGSDNLYITGRFSGNAVDFDPGTATVSLSTGCASVMNCFIAKYDKDGACIWAKALTGCNSIEGNDIVLDLSGNLYVTGYFKDVADFDPGTGTANLGSFGGYSIFHAKYDNNGNYLWARKFGSTGVNEGKCIMTDPSGNSYVAGQYVGTIDFDPGVATYNLTSSTSETFVCKYDGSGGFLWAKNVQGNIVYPTSLCRGTADCFYLTTADGFINKYTGGGDSLWSFKLAYSNIENLTVDVAGNFYPAGEFAGTSDFDPQATVLNLTASGTKDAFIAKYSASSIPSRIKETESSAAFSVAPNPATHQFTLTLSKAVEKDARLVIANMRGQKMKDYALSKKITVISPELATGTYLLTVLNGGKTAAQKIVIQ